MERKITLILLLAFLATSFINCNNKVAFTDRGVDEASSSLGTGTNLSDEEIQEILDRLPAEELASPRPITDLIDYPELLEVYRCSDSDGVVICHFPESVEDQHTQCVGQSAVSTHYDHIREYTLDGINKSIQDYLGPCRVAL